MSKDQRATFAKVLIENGEKAKTFYSFTLERAHWLFGIVASIAAVVVMMLVLRGAVYASVQDVAADEFRKQLNTFHEEAKPAISALIDDRIAASQAAQAVACTTAQHAEEMRRAAELRTIAETLARLDERLEAIENRLDRSLP